MNGWAFAWLLPVLLRLLVPVGFMPMVGEDASWKLVFCDGDGPLAPQAMHMAMPMSMDMPADMPMDGTDPTDAAHRINHDVHGACPYGSAPALGALPTLAFRPFRLLRPEERIQVAAARVAYVQTIHRAQSPRAPPV